MYVVRQREGGRRGGDDKKAIGRERVKSEFRNFFKNYEFRNFFLRISNFENKFKKNPTLKTYPLHIIVEADAISCGIFLSASVQHGSCIFLLVNTYARFIVFVSQNLHRAYERFLYFVKNGCAGTA